MICKSMTAALGAAALALVPLCPAGAADLGPGYGRRAPPPAFDTRAPLAIESWTGFYFGATLGYASGSTGVEGGSGAFSFDQDGFAGTMFGGYNWQLSGIVVGLEADIGTGDLGGSAISAGSSIQSELNVFGSLRGRAGVLMSPQTLLYATAGLAWADYDFSVTGARTASETLLGYQVGAGLELLLAPQWTLRAEYIYTDLGSERLDHVGLANNYDPDFHTFRAGIGLKF